MVSNWDDVVSRTRMSCLYLNNMSSTWLEYFKKYSVSDPLSGLNVFFYVILNGYLDVYLLFYTWSPRASMDPPVDSHTSRAHFWSSEHFLVVVYVEHPLGVAAVVAALGLT